MKLAAVVLAALAIVSCGDTNTLNPAAPETVVNNIQPESQPTAPAPGKEEPSNGGNSAPSTPVPGWNGNDDSNSGGGNGEGSQPPVVVAPPAVTPPVVEPPMVTPPQAVDSPASKKDKCADGKPGNGPKNGQGKGEENACKK